MNTALLTAATEGVSGVNVTQFLQFGLLGVVFLCVVLRKYIVPEWSLRQLEDQRDAELKAKDEQIASLRADKAELKESLDQLQDLTRTEIIPALVRANQLQSAYVAELPAGRGPGA